jgi:hypothetical protein
LIELFRARESFVRVQKSTPRRLATIKKDKAHLLLNCAGVLVRANIENDSAIQRDPAACWQYLGYSYLFLLRTSATLRFQSAGIFNLRKTQQPWIIVFPCEYTHLKRGNLFLLTAVAARPKKTQQHCFERGNFGSGHSPAIQERTKRPFD